MSVVDLSRLPRGAAVVVEAWRRWHLAPGNKAHHEREYLRQLGDLTDAGHRAATDAIGRIQAGAKVIERPAHEERQRAPEAAAWRRFGGVVYVYPERRAG